MSTSGSSADSAGAIFLDLGLNIAQLESGFVDANRTIQQNLNRLNRERNTINLRTQVETSGLDEATQQAQILETRQRALTQQLSIQRDRVSLTSAAYRQLNNTQGATATSTQEAEARFQREQVSLQRLEQQLQRVTDAQRDLAIANTAATSGTAESSLINANQSIQQNLSRLGRERTSIREDAQREIAGLDPTNQQRQIVDIRGRALSRQLEIQRARTQLVETAYNELAHAQGTSSTAAQNMQTRLQREQAALQRLEQQLQRVTEAQNSFTASTAAAAQNSRLNANQSFQQNLNRLRQEREAVATQAQVEISALDEATQQTQILATQQRSLNEQLEIQQARVQLVEEAHRQLSHTQGAGAAATRDMEFRLQREQLALQELQQQLQRVTDAQTELSAVSSLASQSSLVDTNQSLQQNLNRLGRERDLTDLRAQVEIGGLDEAADQTRILEIRQRSLNEQLNIQRTRIRIVEEAHRRLTSAQGANSTAAQDMEASLQRERIALQRLEQQLSNVTAAQERLNSASGTSNTGDSSDSSSGGGLDSLVDGVLDRIPPQAKAAAAAMAGLGAAIFAAGEASTDLIERWRELQTQAYELNMTVTDTENFLRHMRLAGGDIGDFEGYIRGITDAWTKGEWDDPEFLTLRKYGANIATASGKLKDFKTITEEVFKAYKKAKAEGTEIEFLQLTGGESGIRDAIQYFERYEEAKEDAAKIATAKLDTTEFHAAERALNLYNEQAQEFVNALENLITPARVAALESLFEVFHDGTEYLVENKNEIQRWGFIAAETFDTIADKLSALKSAFSELPDLNLYGLAKDILPEEAFSLGGFNFLDKAKDSLFGGILERADTKQVEAATKEHIQKVLKAQEDLNRVFRQQRAALNGDPTTQYGMQRLQDLKDELKDVNAEISNFKHGYELELAQLDIWRERAYRQNDLSKKEREAIEKLYAAKRLQIEQETQDKLDDLRDEATEEFKTDLEKRNIEIKNSMEDWIDAGMEEAEAEKYAQELKAKAIEDWNDEVAANIDSIWQNSLEQRLAEIEREKQSWIDKGLEEVKATKWAEKAKADAREDYINNKIAPLTTETADIEFEAIHSAFEKQLRDIEQWKQAQLDKAETAEEVAAIIENAAMKEADSFEREMDRIRGKIESAQDKLARLTLSQYENDIYQAQKEYYQNIQDNVPKKMASYIYDIEVANAKKRAKEDKSGSYTKRPNNNGEDYGQLLDFAKFNKQLDSTAETLIKMDAEELARTEMLQKASNSIGDIDRSLAKADISTQKLTSINAEAEYAGEQLTQQLQDTTITAQDLGDNLDVVNSAFNQNVSAVKDATSAADTFKNGLEKFIDIENAKRAQDNFALPEKQTEDNTRFKVMYGDEPQKEYKGIEIFYGDAPELNVTKDTKDTPALYSKFAQLEDATDKNADIDNLTDSADKAAQSLANIGAVNFDNVTDSADKAAQSLANIESADLQRSLAEITGTTSTFNDALEKAGDASSNVATAFENAAKIISENRGKFSQSNSNNQASSSTEGDTVDKALDATQSAGKIISLASAIATFAGSMTPQTAAATAIVGGVIETLADLAQQTRNFNDADKTAPVEKSSDIEQNLKTSGTKENETLPYDFSPLQTAFNSFNSELDNAQLVISEFTLSLKNSADKINELSLNAPQNDILSDITQIFSNSVFSQMTQELSTLSQTVGDIAQNVSALQKQRQQPPNITVSPNISIDLGGAYVFDNQLKNQLTDDIATEVADAVKSAVETATTQASYGYGN